MQRPEGTRFWLNEFYKKGSQEKSSASTGGEKILFSRSSPLSVRVPLDFAGEVFALACLPSLWGSSADGDDANRVWKGWQASPGIFRVHHGSIGGSRPIAISVDR
ncbi:MAG: hypothetical protein WA628_06750, partial [Terriglobales bacterium]